MADKPEYVDLISEATRQNRRAMRVDVEPIPVKERSRMGHRPPRLAERASGRAGYLAP